jgi:Ca-activated chloride channel family protein
MRYLTAAFLVLAMTAVAQDDPKPIEEKFPPIQISVEPLGDTPHGVAARIRFEFANPRQITDAGLFLQGSFMQDAKVTRNFRFEVPRENDQGVWSNTFRRNGKTVRETRWALLPDKRNQMTAVHTFAVGQAEIEARLILEADDDGIPALVGKAIQTFTFAKTGKPYVAAPGDAAEGIFAEGIVPEATGAVTIRDPRRDVAPNLFIVNVDVLPPVKRVEFWVEGKKILARNSPPYTAELDLGKLPKRVEVRAVGYDAAGHYVDADAFVVNERDTPLEVKITRTDTSDGLTNFKLSIQNPKGANLKKVVLYAADRTLFEWDRPPYAVSVPTASLQEDFVRASVIDETGYEASDLLFLKGDRYTEEIDVDVVELPVLVTDHNGTSITDLSEGDFTVLERDKPQKITSFNFASNLPISVGVLLDQSGSMKERMDAAKSAAVSFFKSIMRQGDRAFIGSFAADPSRNAPFVSDAATLENEVNAIGEANGSTALYDAIVTGLYRFRNMQGRKALIIITDGDDTSSRLSHDDMLSYARAARVPLYFIGIGFGFGDIGGPGMMKSLAAETGGAAFFIRNAKQLGETYARLEAELRSQYLLTYHTETSKTDQEYRAIEVKVNRPDAKVRTIRGFIP